jgi:transposase
LLKNIKNQTTSQLAKLKDLEKYNLKAMKCRILREAFNKFWQYQSVTWAKKFLQQWVTRGMRSRLEPMKKVARMLSAHEELILNWFRLDPRLSNGVSEGFNNKAKLVMRKAYRFKQFQIIELMLYHILGDLPMPPLTHRFL